MMSADDADVDDDDTRDAACRIERDERLRRDRR